MTSSQPWVDIALLLAFTSLADIREAVDESAIALAL